MMLPLSIMLLGAFFALAACFVWGAIFVVPEYLSDFTGLEIALGRYLVYGTLSLLIFFLRGKTLWQKIPLTGWAMALVFSLLGNVLYYLGIIAGVRYTSASLSVLIVGLSPITIALYGNFHSREVSFKSLILPSLWIVTGLILVNVAEIDWTFSTYSMQQYLMGILGIFGSLIFWSWFVVHNAHFLKKYTSISTTDWATVIGVATLFWALLFSSVLGLGPSTQVNLDRFAKWSEQIFYFLLGITFLATICSWLGCYFWGQASRRLPISLVGPLLIFESIFGLLFVFLSESRLPSLTEMLGVISMLGGVTMSIYLVRKSKLEPE